jgi:hypothetical protein
VTTVEGFFILFFCFVLCIMGRRHIERNCGEGLLSRGGNGVHRRFMAFLTVFHEAAQYIHIYIKPRGCVSFP